MKKTFRVPMYGVRVTFFDSVTLVDEYVRRQGGDGIGDETLSDGITACDGSQVIIGIERENCCPDVIAHECLHAAFRILGIVGIKIAKNNHEALAYLLGYLVGKWHQKMPVRGDAIGHY